MSLHDAKHVQYSVSVWASDWVPYPYKWTHVCMVTQPANAISKVVLCEWADGKTNEKVKIPPNFVPCEPACRRLLFPLLCPTGLFNRGGSRIFFRRGCTRLFLYFNTNKPHSFFLQNTSCNTENRRSSQGGGGAQPLHPPPRSAPVQSVKRAKILNGSVWTNVCTVRFFRQSKIRSSQ